MGQVIEGLDGSHIIQDNSWFSNQDIAMDVIRDTFPPPHDDYRHVRDDNTDVLANAHVAEANTDVLANAQVAEANTDVLANDHVAEAFGLETNAFKDGYSDQRAQMHEQNIMNGQISSNVNEPNILTKEPVIDNYQSVLLAEGILIPNELRQEIEVDSSTNVNTRQAKRLYGGYSQSTSSNNGGTIIEVNDASGFLFQNTFSGPLDQNFNGNNGGVLNDSQNMVPKTNAKTDPGWNEQQ
ncbi:unnamed protein product, partial [Meganyctiphanes norvegica]